MLDKHNYTTKKEKYINFDDRYNRIGFGTWNKSWDIDFKGNRTDI